MTTRFDNLDGTWLALGAVAAGIAVGATRRGSRAKRAIQGTIELVVADENEVRWDGVLEVRLDEHVVFLLDDGMMAIWEDASTSSPSEEKGGRWVEVEVEIGLHFAEARAKTIAGTDVAVPAAPQRIEQSGPLQVILLTALVEPGATARHYQHSGTTEFLQGDGVDTDPMGRSIRTDLEPATQGHNEILETEDGWIRGTTSPHYTVRRK